MSDDTWDQIWFLSRFAVGLILFSTLLFVVFWASATVFTVWSHYFEEHQELSPFPPRVAGSMIAVTLFLAGSAGISWFKITYIRMFLPDALERAKKDSTP